MIEIKKLEERIDAAKSILKNSEYILLGAGAGLSDAAGIKYSGESFSAGFASFIQRYGFTDMYTSSFYPFKTQEEKWAYWARHIFTARYESEAKELYLQLFKFLKDRNYFIITTNVDGQFEKAGFPTEKIFEVQGNYAYLQCEKACHNKLYYNESLVKEMIQKTFECRVPASLVPKCPVCGGHMEVNLRKDNNFIQDEKWYIAQKAYTDFSKQLDNTSVAYLEFGVGFNTPGIIRYPFEVSTNANAQARLIRFNRDYSEGFSENEEKTLCFTEEIAGLLSQILNYA